MKIVIENRDIDDPAETKEISAVALDLVELEASVDLQPNDLPQPESVAAGAATASTTAQSAAGQTRNKSAHREIEEGVTELARKLAKEKLGGNMSASVTVRTFQKRPPGFGNFEEQVVQLFLNGEPYLSMSNADLANHMSGKYEGFTVPQSLFYSPLKPWAKKKVRAMLAQWDRRLDLSGKPTLSSIKQALKGNAARQKPCRDYGADFSFSDETVVVNGRAYEITVTKEGYRRIRVNKGQWISVENLEVLLAKDRPPLLSDKI